MHRTLLSLETIPLALTVMLTLLGTAVAHADFPDVSKLPSHPDLPDPLVMFNGDRVTTKEQWTEKRRPELKSLFEYYMYGQAPAAPDHVDAKVERIDPKAFEGKATLQEITISFGPPDTPKRHLLLVTPNARKGPAPVFVGMNFHGNHALLDDPAVRLPDGVGARQGGRGEGQPRCRRRPRHGGRCVGAGAVDRPRLRRGDVLLRRH